MADIEVRRKPATWVWILPAVVLALLIWAVAGGIWNDERAQAAPETEPPLPVVLIVTQPAEHRDRTVTGVARVGPVISDRAFWLEEAGKRVLVILDEPKPETMNIDQGQWVRLTATVRGADQLDSLPGELEADARSAAKEQQAFLSAQAENVTIVDRKGT
jgi:hypothetical protein